MPRFAWLAVGLVVAFSPRYAHADLPAAVVQRPSTLDDGMLQLDAALDHESRQALGVDVLDAQTLRVAARWGVSAHLEVGLETSVRLHPDAHWVREATPALAWRVVESPAWDLTPTVRVPLFADHGYDVGTHMDLGLGLRWRVADRVLLGVGRTLTSVDFRPVVAWHVLLDADVGVQVTPTVELEAAARLGIVTLAGPLDRTIAPWSELPLSLRAIWAAHPGLDAIAEVGTAELQAPRDGFVVLLGVAVRP